MSAPPGSATQKDWEEWARRRIAEAPRIAKVYEHQGAAVLQALRETGCTCNPLIGMTVTQAKAKVSSITHDMFCERRP